MLSGNAVELGDAGEVPGKSFLFFLTNYGHEIELFREVARSLAEQGTIRFVRNFLDDGAPISMVELLKRVAKDGKLSKELKEILFNFASHLSSNAQVGCTLFKPIFVKNLVKSLL